MGRWACASTAACTCRPCEEREAYFYFSRTLILTAPPIPSNVIFLLYHFFSFPLFIIFSPSPGSPPRRLCCLIFFGFAPRAPLLLDTNGAFLLCFAGPLYGMPGAASFVRFTLFRSQFL